MCPERKPVIAAIDDDSVVLNFLVSMLKSDYSIRPFTSGKIALDLLPALKPDLILLDYQMPDMMGLDVLRALGKNPETRNIPTIILTGTVDSGEVEAEALDFGAVDYITKPIRHRALLTRVRSQLELQKHRKQLEELVAVRTKNLYEANQKLKQREDITLSMLAKATDLRDHDTGGHIERTAEFTRIIAQHITRNPAPDYSLSQELAEDVVRCSKLHDVGKIALPDHILFKPGKLSREEFDLVKEHTVRGEQFLSEFVNKSSDIFLETAREIAYAHHERWDGSGYPMGTTGGAIPLSARIVAIADVYDALTSFRPYKTPFSHGEAVEFVEKGSGTHFDPYLVEIFLEHADEFRAIREQSEAESFGVK